LKTIKTAVTSILWLQNGFFTLRSSFTHIKDQVNYAVHAITNKIFGTDVLNACLSQLFMEI